MVFLNWGAEELSAHYTFILNNSFEILKYCPFRLTGHRWIPLCLFEVLVNAVVYYMWMFTSETGKQFSVLLARILINLSRKINEWVVFQSKFSTSFSVCPNNLYRIVHVITKQCNFSTFLSDNVGILILCLLVRKKASLAIGDILWCYFI